MTTSDSILVQLAEAKATADALGEMLRQPAIVIAAFCVDLEIAGHAKSQQIGDPDKGRKLALWSITPAGKARVESLKASV